MGQIVRSKKKGRPSKADLARRNSSTSEQPPESEPRRSLRRRNVRYNFDIDDYVDDEDYFYEDDDEDVKRREKKLRLLLKLDQEGEDSESTRRVSLHAPTSYSEYDDDKPSKKRKIDGDDELDGEDEEDNDVEDEQEEVRGRKVEARGANSVPGTPSDLPSGFPLPDKKTLELILDKLQKKDIYGVYAEPVDPEELPDYHDVIKHPMDFATVRIKLGNGAYSTLEQIESDVLLICANAMQYNAPDTIYYKQASSIQELAKRKFQRLRINVERSDMELKLDQKTTSSLLLPKKQQKKLVGRTVPEPVGSDFSSGATLATAGEFQNGSCAVQTTSGRPNSVDGLLAENSSMTENNLDKGEELQPGKGYLSRLGRKPSVHDENRRVTYNILTQPIAVSESIYSTFEGESKQLVPVGLHADHSYARSLALFAATLGSVAWTVASQRIEQALPEGSKFGRGWVGEYEPLPTPVLMLENCTLKESDFITRCSVDVRENKKTSTNSVLGKELHDSGRTSEGKQPLFGNTCIQLSAKKESPRGASLDTRPPFFSSPRAKPNEFVTPNYQQQNLPSRNLVEPEKKKVSTQVELNYPPPTPTNKSATDFIAERQISNGSDLPPASRSAETVSRNRNLLPSASFTQSNNNGFVAGGGPSNGKAITSSVDSIRTVTSSSSISNPNPMTHSNNNYPIQQEQGLSDPVQLMKMLAEKAQHHKSSIGSPNDSQQAVPQVPSPRGEDPNNAALAAAHAWMSLGGGGVKVKTPAENTSSHKHQISSDSLYNPARQVSRFRGEFPVQGMHFQPPDKNSSYPVHAFVPQPVVRMANEAHSFQNRPIQGFPQFVTADLSRFQMQSPWRGVTPQMQPRPKQESRPPDLNIGFQSVGSPVRQSSGVLVDSQQPDLALQL